MSLGIHPDSASILRRSANCPASGQEGQEQRSSEEGILNEGVATLTVYGCDEGTGVVQLTRGSTVLASISIRVSDTPPPVEPDPTGSLTASPGTIERRGSSLVTARWSPASQEVRLVVGTAILRTTPCASTGGRGASATEATRQLAVYGCASGYGLVRLETIPPAGGAAETLATITIRVATDPPDDPEDTPTPTPTPSAADPEPPGPDPKPTPELPTSGSPSQRAYRWLDITWTAPGDYVRFEIEASVDGGDWGKLTEVRSGRPVSGGRAIIDHRAQTAHVRGLDYSGGTTLFRVTGITDNDLKRTSAVFTLVQGDPPKSVGHQHDHTVAYNFGSLGTDDLDDWVRQATPAEASKWNALPLVAMCKQLECTTNTTGVITVSVIDTQCTVRGVACITVGNGIEDHLRDTTISLERSPTSAVPWEWTDNSALHKKGLRLTVPQRYYLHVNPVILHELGHALGLPDFRSPTTYRGIMRQDLSVTSITQSDKDLLREIYESHTPGEGW